MGREGSVLAFERVDLAVIIVLLEEGTSIVTIFIYFDKVSAILVFVVKVSAVLVFACREEGVPGLETMVIESFAFLGEDIEMSVSLGKMLIFVSEETAVCVFEGEETEVVLFLDEETPVILFVDKD